MKRHSKKKCDLVYPICSHCRRLNLVCAHEEPRAGEAVTQRASVISLPNLCRPLVGAVVPSPPVPAGLSGYHIDESSSLVSLRRRMLLYYTERLANLMSTNLQHNSFLSGSKYRSPQKALSLITLCFSSSSYGFGVKCAPGRPGGMVSIAPSPSTKQFPNLCAT